MTAAPALTPQPRSQLDQALLNELSMIADPSQAAMSLIAKHGWRTVSQWLRADAQDLLTQRAREIQHEMRLGHVLATATGSPYTPGPRLIGAHAPGDERYDLPAPFLRKFIHELTREDVEEIVESYSRYITTFTVYRDAWQEVRALLDQHNLPNLAELRAAGIALPKAI